MNSDWTDEEAVLQDLAIAQGFVPGGIVNGVLSNNRPRTLQIKEETEEQFLRDYVVDEDAPIGPDLKHIQEMLNMVRDVSVNEFENTNPDKGTDGETKRNELSDYNAQVPTISKKKTKKQMRNVAVASLLGLNEKSLEDNETDTVVDAKPNAEAGSARSGDAPFVMSPCSMFRPKSNKSDLSTRAATPPHTNNIPRVQNKPAVFVPSSQAQEYYNRIMENKKKEEVKRETIWSKAEREMREIEAKRKLEKDAVDNN